MRLRAGVATLVALEALACSGMREPTALLGPVRSADYAVYDAVLDGLFGVTPSDSGVPRYVIGDSTTPGQGSESDLASASVQKQFGPLLARFVNDTRVDYVARSATRVPLDVSSFHPQGRVELLSGRVRRELAEGTSNPNEFWRAFYARFPGARGHITFSRPGFDASGDHALLSYWHGCGGLCGDGGYILLERRGEKWVVLRRVITGAA